MCGFFQGPWRFSRRQRTGSVFCGFTALMLDSSHHGKSSDGINLSYRHVVWGGTQLGFEMFSTTSTSSA